MSYNDVVTRISEIQTQIAALHNAFTPSAATSATAPAAASTTGTGAGVSSNFATALAQAQAGGQSTVGQSTLGLGAGAAVGSTALPPKAAGMLTTGQQQFASRLAADTGLDPGVIAAWMLAEESGGAAQSRQSANNNDWLNIGYTDSGTYGSSDSIWSNPVTAADATAGWLKGQDTIPGYGHAAAGIQAIMQTAGQSPQAQMAAIENSGWASGGYPELAQLFSQVA
jgi:hypothetical protein